MAFLFLSIFRLKKQAQPIDRSLGNHRIKSFVGIRAHKRAKVFKKPPVNGLGSFWSALQTVDNIRSPNGTVRRNRRDPTGGRAFSRVLTLANSAVICDHLPVIGSNTEA
jgi:hypothetical protein